MRKSTCVGTTDYTYHDVPIWDELDCVFYYPYIRVQTHGAYLFYSPDRAAVRIDLEQYGTPVLMHIGKTVDVVLTFELNAITESKVIDYG